jgi:hypothetical protein
VREDNRQVAQFAEKLKLHAQSEEQVLNPAAIVLGDYLRLKLNKMRATPGQAATLPALVLNGFYNYYAVPTNFRAPDAFYYHVLWRWLPSPRLRHPYHDWPFDVMNPRWEPGV